MKAEVLNKHEARFMDWLAAKHPRLKEAILQSEGNQLHGWTDNLASTINNVISGAGNVLTAYVNGKQQIDLVKLNWARAKQGLPLYNSVADYQADLQRSVSTSGRLMDGGMTILKSPLFWIAVGVGAFFLIRGRRR